MNAFGVLYAVTFNDLFACNPNTAACYYLGALPQSFNGLTALPVGVLDPTKETLVGVANSGAWCRLDVSNGQIAITQIGQYGAGYTSAGDAYSIDD